jgi:hypothetical protein
MYVKHAVIIPNAASWWHMVSIALFFLDVIQRLQDHGKGELVNHTR